MIPAGDGGTERQEVSERFVSLDGCFNFRDLDGHTAAGGRTVRRGLVCRSDALKVYRKLLSTPGTRYQDLGAGCYDKRAQARCKSRCQLAELDAPGSRLITFFGSARRRDRPSGFTDGHRHLAPALKR